MSTHEKDTFTATYNWAKDWQDLPWSHEEPTLFLPEICRRRKPGTALDIGCGGGTDSVYLAQQGWDVTSLDFVDKAIEYTEKRAAAAGVSVTPVVADITAWEPPQQYDLILDHGLLHNMDPVRYDAYRACLMKALAPGGEFVLLHWHPRYPGQTNGKMGPTRVSREDIKTFFAPDLLERYFAIEDFEDLPSLVGGGMCQAYYWFRLNQSWQQPAELVQQIEATLEAQGVDLVAVDAESEAKSVVDDSLLAVMLGPGRFGYSHVQPEPDGIAPVLADLAERAGQSPERLHNLLSIFGDKELGGICMPDARCDACSVSFCKRLRYR